MLAIEVFGPTRVVTPAARLTGRDFHGVKPRQVLEVLAAERGHTVPKSRLCELVWGDAVPPNHTATLETYVSLLRQVLEPGVRARDSVVQTAHGGYALDTERVQVDLDVFDQHLRDAGRAAPDARLQHLHAALAVVRGRPLEDEPYARWAEEVRDVYLGKQLQALVDAARLSLATGALSAALGLAEAATALAPLAETAYRLQMTAAYALSRQDDALQAFDRCRRLLADELGVDPVAETTDLHLAILRHDDPATLLPPPVAAPVVLALAPAPASLAPAVLAQRRPAAALRGREPELEQLHARLTAAAGGRWQTVVVAGEPGIGKSRLLQAFTASCSVPVGANRCSDLEQELPYLALSLALLPLLAEGEREGLPVLQRLLATVQREEDLDAFARLRVMEEVAGVLTAHAPVVLALDDVQWADAETLRTLGYLQRRCPDLPVLVLLTCRTDAREVEALDAVHCDLRLDLDVLPPDAVDDPALLALTGGHPLFLDGWRRAREAGLQQDFPPDVRELVLSRCWTQGSTAYRLLGVVAALDAPARLDLLPVLLRTEARELVELVDRLVVEGLLTADESTVTLRLPAVRAVLRQTLTPAHRLLVQQQAARWSLPEERPEPVRSFALRAREAVAQ